MEMAGIFCIIEVFFMQTFLFVGMCEFSATFATDLDVSLNELSASIQDRDKKASVAKQIELTPKFNQLIRFQNDSRL